MKQNEEKEKEYSVLLVDDDPDIIQWLTLVLEPQGIKTYAAVDAFTALYYCKKYKPDMMILDLHLGDHEVGGTEILWTLKNDPALASIVVLVFTGCRDESVKKLCTDDLGADGYLIKGEAHRLDLASTIRAWLRHLKVHNAQEDLVSGPLRVNLAEGKATINEKPLPLTPREFNVLAYLAKHSPNIMSWETMARKLWGKPNGPYLFQEPELIEACLAHIKFKLGREAGRHLITVPSAGATWTGKGYFTD